MKHAREPLSGLPQVVVQVAVLHAVSLARVAVTGARGRIAKAGDTHAELKAELGRAQAEGREP